MMNMFGLLLGPLLLQYALADLPAGCLPLNEQSFSTSDPTLIYEENTELADIIPPRRMGDWRVTKAFPTQHFAINQAKGGMSAIRQGPYSVWLESDGVTYDAYTLDRWSNPARSDEMQQQTPSEVGAPWNKVTSVGTNMKQIVSGPDGNPKATFTGRSGVRVGILSAGDPVWSDFGEMYADFMYTDINGGTMEVPLVRGSALVTHRFTNANPVLFPYCLSAVDGVETSFQCPAERDVSDPGEGFTDGTCSGGVLTTYLRSTKPIEDLSLIQWAANSLADWPSSHPMTTCGSECTLSPDQLTVEVTIPSASGTMAFAFNYVGKYVLPPDWVNNPANATCSGKVHASQSVTLDEQFDMMPCDADLCHTPSCDTSGGAVEFGLVLSFTDPVTSPDMVQIAAAGASDWGPTTPMLNCDNPDITCSLSPDGLTLTYSDTFSEETINYAVNAIGRFVKPLDWQNAPYSYTCGQDPGTTTEPPGSTTTGDPGTTTDPGPTVGPSFCTDPPPDLGSCPKAFCKTTFCEAASGSEQYFKLVIQLDEPISDIDQVQIAINTGDDWDSSHGMISCTPDVCTLQPDMQTLVYCNTMPAGPLKYAVNIIGRFIQPPTDWETQPFQVQCGGSGIDLGTGTKFTLELDEPNGNLPGQTRKYVVYFPEPVVATLDANGLNFEPVLGGLYTGIMQMAYAGSTTRGDLSAADFYDQYQGVYSYHPITSFCAQDGQAYLDYNWNKYDANGPTAAGNLLMIALPHHETIVSGSPVPIDTPFTFKGYTGDFWLLEYDLPPSTLDPDPAGVAIVQANPEWNTNVLNGLDVDTASQDLANACDYKDSYWLGKDIAMVTRLASVSRAFGTDHYQQVDPILQTCIEKWLRVQDTLDGAHKFRYDSVYGGLLLRSVPDGQPIDPVANYGFPVYSDHHFHLGYLVYAMAYYAKYYPSWAQTHEERIRLVARDLGSPGTSDMYFPVVRHKDFYIGHSWATGVLAGERQQESSSEAINCYHAIAALGNALGDPVMEQTGQVTLAMEIHSVRSYYHVRDVSRSHFPPHIQSYGTIGMFGEDNIFLYTLNWPCDPYEFPMRHACLVGIQILPIISVSNLYMDQEWATSVYDSCSWALDPLSAPGAELIDPDILRPVSIGWGAFCHSILAKYDATAQAAAAEYVKDLTPSQLVSGSGVGSTLLWIYGST